MRVLMAEATDYRGPTRVGSHALAREFVRRGATLMWLGSPLYPHTLLRGARDASVARRIDAWRRGGATDGAVTEYYPLTCLPVVDRPLLRSRFVARHTLRATVPPVSGVLRKHGFDRPDLLWLSASRFSFPLLRHVGAARRAYRMSDDWGTFPNVPRSLIEFEERIIDAVDAVFVTARILEERVRVRRKDVVYLPNGVSEAFFDPPAVTDPLLDAFPAPRVVFAGTLGEWIDDDMVAVLAKSLPRASVLLIGPRTAARAELPPNVAFTGPVAYERLPAILHGCQVGIIPFRRTPRTEAASSNKLFQFLAAGLPVVATRTHEFEQTRSPAVLCDDAESFAGAVASLVDGGPAGRESRVAFARAHTWSARYETVARTLGI